MLFIQIAQLSLLRDIDYSASPLLWVIAHTQLFFPLLLGRSDFGRGIRFQAPPTLFRDQRRTAVTS